MKKICLTSIIRLFFFLINKLLILLRGDFVLTILAPYILHSFIGLSVAYLSGRHQSNGQQFGTYTQDDVDALRAIAEEPGIVDLFLTYPCLAMNENHSVVSYFIRMLCTEFLVRGLFS